MATVVQSTLGMDTNELCPEGHKMKLMTVEDAMASMYTDCNGVIGCGSCKFIITHDQKIFVCIMCRSNVSYVGKHRTKVYNKDSAFCETCVSTKKVNGAVVLKPEFTTGLFECCGGNMNHFADALFCFPCKLGRVAHWVQFKYQQDGRVKGKEDGGEHKCSLGGCICAWTSLLFMVSTCLDLFGIIWFLYGGMQSIAVKQHVGVDSSACCCWDFVCCPICAVARWQREIKLHRGEDIPGCCAGISWDEVPAARRPPRVAYQYDNMPAPAALGGMGAVTGVPVVAGLNAQPAQPSDPWGQQPAQGGMAQWGSSYPAPQQQGHDPAAAGRQRFCSGCGKEFLPTDNFCGGCGTKRP